MILKALTLENIRSYKDKTQLEIPTGITLFVGDIASGKSTLLYAIEFALFGLGSLKGSFLLRNDARQGHVSLLFEVDGKEYEVHRSLVKKGKSVQQDECFIRGPEGKAVLSPSEIKERILQILRFNELANPKAQSVIYRYAIFTPQEEMKEVILKDADERLQTLRKAFRIEDYKIAAENSLVVASRIKEKRDYLQGVTEDLDKLKATLGEVIQNIQKFVEERKLLKEREDKIEKEREKKEQELKELEKEREKIKKAEERIPLLNKQISDKTDMHQNLTRGNTKLQKIMEKLQPRIHELKAIKRPTEKTREQLKQEIKGLRTKKDEAERQKAKLEERIGNFESILQKGVCPVCERTVDSKEFSNKIQHLVKEKSRLEEQIRKAENDIVHTETLIDQLSEYEKAQKELQTLHSQLKEAEERIEENSRIIEELEKSIEELKAQLKSAEEETKPLQKVLKNIEELETEIRDLDKKLNSIGKEIAKFDEKIRGLKESQKQYNEQIALKEKQRRIMDSLNEHMIWLREYFAPTVENIEKHVMVSLNQKFNQQFQRWFQILIEDPDLQVRVDEEFSPIIEREGYEQNYNQLSGGERTSVALAYRLALNTIVQEVAIGGGANLLILDEPSDGFSKEQLFKIRDILNELGCQQIILVSHERELEGFADHVFRVEKVHGVSKMSKLVR